MKTRTLIAAGCAGHDGTTTRRSLIFRRAWLWTGFLAFATIAFGSRSAQAAVTEAWVQRYSNLLSNAAAQAVKVVRDAAGDIIVTGSTGLPGTSRHDILTIKYSGADGSVLWQQRYNSSGNTDDRPSALAVDASGNVVVTGNSDIGSIASVYQSYTAKYAAADGELLWERRHYGPANSVETVHAVAVDDGGNVVVTGNSLTGLGSEIYTAKFAAADGALLWEKRYGSGHLTAVVVDGNGNVVVAGRDNSDYYTAKYATLDGSLLWERRYNGAANGDNQATGVGVDGSGNVVVTGWVTTGSLGQFPNTDYYTAKYAAADGALLWEKRHNGSYDYATAVAVDGSNNVVVTGHSESALGSEIYTAKYAAADGGLVWEQRYNNLTNSQGIANAVAVDSSGNVVVTGFFGRVPNTDYYTAKYAAADGALLWEKRHNGPANSYDSANAVAVDGSGNVVVTGWTDVESGLERSSGGYYTAKYAAADGALLWEQRYDGSAPNLAEAHAVVVDGSGNVVVTGVAYNWGGDQSSNSDYYTAKYAGVNGALLWEKHYNGPANRDDFASALAVDGSGNVVVTGASHNGTNFDYYTAKHAAANGALLWEKRYNGPANRDDSANAMALDSGGNVVVTGYSDNGTNYNYYTAKYAAADGALVWQKRSNRGGYAMTVDGTGNVIVTGSSYNGTNFDHYTTKYAAANGALLWEKRGTSGGAVAVDGSGNVVVTGSFYNGTNSDYYTTKYAAADGALLWEQRYNGPTNDLDSATAVVVDGGGNVVVTGYSGAGFVDSFGTWNPDYYTAKYAAADGALLWEKRLTGPATVADSSHCLALGADGMVAVTGTANDGYATVVYREVPEVVSINLVPTGVRLRFSGISGRPYNIERASAVTGHWSTINTQTASASGHFEYLDTTPDPGSGFYRIVQP